jgi:hypothetical protein
MTANSRALYHHDVQICIEIRRDIQGKKTLVDAIKNDWPTEINFALIGPRVANMRNQLFDYLHYKDKLAQSPVWKAFRQENPDISYFARNLDAQQANIGNARPG